MKTIKNNISRVLFALFTLLAFSGCSDYFTNPLEDKETGEDINLLIVDFNFFTTRMTFKLLDVNDGSPIYANAKVRFSGVNGNDIVSFTGEKNQVYLTSEGQLELTTDPNIAISSNSPFKFAVTVEIDGYNTLTKGFQLNSEGIKSFELKLAKVSDEEIIELPGNIVIDGNDTTFHFSLQPVQMKSANVGDKPYTIDYSMTLDDFLKFKGENGALLFVTSNEVIAAYNNDPANFIKVSFSVSNNYPSEIDMVNINGTVRSVLFNKLETGKLTSLVIAGKKVSSLNGGKITSTSQYTGDIIPDIFGFATFNPEEYWNIIGTQNVYTNVNFDYTLVQGSNDGLCETGVSINFKSTVSSSFSIDADVFDVSGKLITSMNFKGKFPETFVVENVPTKAVKLVFRNTNPAFQTIPPLEISDFCNGSYEVNVLPKSGYVQYQVVIKGLCSGNNQVAISPTYSAEIRLKNSGHPWQGISMVGGVADILCMPDQEYEFRLLWDKSWEYANYYTKFDASGNYLGTPFTNTVIKSKKLPDGRVQINVEIIFEQNICDDMNW